MKFLIALSAVVLAVSSMPTEVGKDFDVGQEFDVEIPAEVDKRFDNGQEFDVDIPTEIVKEGADTFNGTARNIPFGQAGFAAIGSGTRGGAGGAVWTVWDAWALRDALNSNDRRIVYIRGRIDLTVLFTGSPGVALNVGRLTSVIGGDRNAMIFGGGLRISNTDQVIVQNIKFHNALSYAPGEQPNGNGGIISQVPGAWSTIDNIGVENSVHVWIDHCEFADDPWNANNVPDNQRRHDGLLDITRGANLISVSNNIFRNHNLVMLVGNDDNNAAQDRGRLKVTYYLNWFQGTTQRNPRVRYGEVHVLNNLYTDIRSYAIGAGAGASIYGERNVFINTRRSWGFPAGTPNPMGYFLNFNNLLINSQHDAGIPGGVTWRPEQYYGYTPMSAFNVEDHVRRNAGIW